GLEATIPSFDAYVKRAKELGVKLLVELKPHGGEPNNYAQIFIDKMRQLGVETQYKTMSLDLKVMEEIERLAPEIETGYVIPIQLGGFGDNQVDFFVIEDFSYQDYLADQAHDQGKAVYVWTINDNEKIRKYLQKPVDAIITDQPDQVAKIRQKLQSHNGNYLDYLLQLASGN
ncbi:glycerophosphodiester phosphodiesterase family protein, partial [Abiotrophia defectiva]